MKRIFAFLLAAMLLLLAACAPATAQGNSAAQESNQPQQEKPDSLQALVVPGEIHLIPLPTNTGPDLAQVTSSTGEGYYYTDILFPLSANILYLDYATGTERPLCTQPECEHNRAGCSSFFGLDEQYAVPETLVVNGMLVYGYGTLFEEPYQIMAADLEGKNRHTLATLPSNWQTSLAGSYTDGRCFYLFIKERNRGEESYTLKLIEINLETGETRVLKDFEWGDEAQLLRGALGRRLLLSTLCLDAQGTLMNRFYWLDVDTGEEADILWQASENMGCSFAGEEIFVRDGVAKTATGTNLYTGAQWQFDYAPYMQDIGPVYQEYCYPAFDDVRRLEFISPEGEETSFVLDRTTGEVREFTLTDSFRNQSLVIVEEEADSLLVLLGYIEAPNGPTERIYIPHFGLLSKTDYWASQANYQEFSVFEDSL